MARLLVAAHFQTDTVWSSCLAFLPAYRTARRARLVEGDDHEKSSFEIACIEGTTVTAGDEDAVVAAAQRILSERVRRTTVLDSPNTVRDFLTLQLSPYQREVFAVVLLDNRHRVIDTVELFFGTIDGASVHPREVVKAALAHNAAAVILAHNHPSGVAEPSQADQAITDRLKAALALVDVRVLDHFVVAGGHCVSFAERGLI